MAGIVYLAFFLAGGLHIARYWLPKLRPLVRWYVGLCFGLLLMMWLPALWAYLITFSVTAHLVAALTLLVLMLFAYVLRDPSPRVRFGAEDRRMLKAVLAVTVPLAVLAAWLMYTHSIRPAADGSYHVGQSTYGDLSLHLAVATSIVNAKFPLQNSLMVGATMAYPYLADSFATTLYMLGMSLPTAMAFTGTLMCVLVIGGFALLTAQLAKRRGAVALATCLLFLNGGLGFFFTLSGTTDGGVITTAWDHLRTVMEGYYKTPTNQPDPNNLRWVNILCDMLVPQRGILGGWTMLMPVFNLLLPPLVTKRRHASRAMLLAGVMAGGLPLLHTHSFLALVLCSLGFCVYATVTAPRGRRMDAFRPFLLYGSVAAALSLPQLVDFTFVQATASDHFLRFQFNWCNNRGGQGLIDPYFWFYIKNIGLPYLLILLALLERRSGALREEAERAAAMTDGLFMPEPPTDSDIAQDKATAAHEQATAAALEAAQPMLNAQCAPLAANADAATVQSDAADVQQEEPVRTSVFAHEMPAYGESRLPQQPPDFPRIGADLPYLRPIAPEKLRAASFSPDDQDRVGVMRAVTGDAPAETSQRPLLEEIFSATFSSERDAELDAKHKASTTTAGEPETCFADNPPPRDWVRQHRLIAIGAFLILLVAEFVLFQPNEYDNNKLIYVWFLLCLPMAADYALELFARLGGLPGRRTLAALFLAACFLSAGLTVAREAVSDYQAYSVADIAVADFVSASTPEHSVFLTGNQHLNPVASLAGRTIVCGSDLYLYYHGFSTAQRKQEVQAFYEAPRDNLSLLARYGVQYVYVSPSEWSSYAVDAGALHTLFQTVYQSADGTYLVLAVPETYRLAADVSTAVPTATPDPAVDPGSGG